MLYMHSLKWTPVSVQELQEKEQRVLELVDENARLVGHQNPKQKIQYHVQLKEENNYLREVSEWHIYHVYTLFGC